MIYKLIGICITALAVATVGAADQFRVHPSTVVVQPTTVLQKVTIPAYTFRFDGSSEEPSLGSVSIQKKNARQPRLIEDQNVNDDAPVAISGPDDFSDKDLDKLAATVLQRNHCATCHTGPGARAKFPIFADRGRITAKIDRWLIFDKADTNEMPPRPHPPMSKEDKLLLREWARHTPR